MSQYYKTLTDEALRAEIQRLEAYLVMAERAEVSLKGVEEVLPKYRKELALRGRLSE